MYIFNCTVYNKKAIFVHSLSKKTIMSRSKAFTLFLSYCIISLLFSCSSSSGKKVDEAMDVVEQLVEHYPDSALNLLDSLVYPANLNKRQYNRYMLLELQAKDKSYKDITSDTTIWRVKSYYLQKKDYSNAAMAAYYCGRVSTEQTRYDRALYHYLEAEKYVSSSENVNLKVLIQSGMGHVLISQFLSNQALPRYHKALGYFFQANNHKNIAITYLALGSIFFVEGKVDSSFYYSFKAQEVADKCKDKVLVSEVKQTISLLYANLKKYKQAKIYLLECLPNIVEDKKSIIYAKLANVLSLELKTDSAEWYLRESVRSLKDEKDNAVLANIYESWSLLNERNGDHKNALEQYKKYTNCIINIIGDNKAVALLDIQKKYKFEQLKNENITLTLQKQKILLYSSLGIILLLAGALFYYRKYTLSKRHELEAEQKIYHLLNMAKSYSEKETTFRNSLLEQFEILKKTASLENHIRQDDGNRSKLLLRKFNEIVYGQDTLNWNRLYKVMNDLHDGFFDRLRERFPHLDEDEFRICCLTYTQFSSSEIAIIMGLSVNTIQMKRSSIRKKLQIPSKGNIPHFLDAALRYIEGETA